MFLESPGSCQNFREEMGTLWQALGKRVLGRRELRGLQPKRDNLAEASEQVGILGEHFSAGDQEQKDIVTEA